MAVLVPNNLVEKNEGYGRTINQFFDIWLKPYYKELRQKFDKQKFEATIIELFDDGRNPKIKLGDNAQIEIEFKKPKIKPEDVGKNISVELKEIKSVNWPSKGMDKNSAKVLLLRFNKDWWILNFDFRYNQGNAKKKIGRAEEFLSACETMLRKKDYCPHVLVYLIWSTAELILDAKFLLHAQKTNNSHYKRQEKLKSPIGNSFFSPNFQTLLLTLYKIRNGARYGNKDYSRQYNIKDFRKYVKTLKEEM